MAGVAVAASSPLFLSNVRKTRLSVSIASRFHKQLTPTLPALLSSAVLQHGIPSLIPPWRTSVRCYDTNKVVRPESEESKKINGKFFGRDTIANAVERFAPAVVNLYVKERGQNGGGKIGSGTIIHEDGFILTCAHILLDTADREVLVYLQDGEQHYLGTLVDAYIDIDIAIVKINPKSASLSAAKLGSSSKLRAGDWAIAMGCPSSLLNTVTLGIISCVHRGSHDLNLLGTPREFLQTDCAINPGNSGGPLCNIDGEVVGIIVDTTKKETATGISFAVPIDYFSMIIKPFCENWTTVRPYFGWVVCDIHKDNVKKNRETYPNYPNVKEGVFVVEVLRGSPAGHAGIQQNDVIVEFNGSEVGSIKGIMDALKALEDGFETPIKVAVRRANDALITLHINLKEKVENILPNKPYIKSNL